METITACEKHFLLESSQQENRYAAAQTMMLSWKSKVYTV